MRRGFLKAVVGVALLSAGGAADAAAQAGVSYTVPPDNPFVGQADSRAEIWAYGLRNPWRFSFDRATGDMVIADVGQNAVEEVDFAPAGTGAGANYGWSCFEGSQPFAGAPAGCAAPGHVPPAFEYSSANDQVACSITGGYVVRDPALIALAGRYLYGDFCSGELRSVQLEPGGSSGDRSTNLRVPAISSFGEDAAGRVYAVSLGGLVLRLRAGVGSIPVLGAPVLGVFRSPVYVTSEPQNANRLYVVEQGGTIKLITGQGLPTNFLNISAAVSTSGLTGERGLLSVAFAPDYATSGLLYVYYTDLNGDIIIKEFRRSTSNPNVADPASGRVVLTQPHREFANHNGGQLQFGPDGMLYAALGDGGGAGNPLGTAQDLGSLLGKVIRIDPRQP